MGLYFPVLQLQQVINAELAISYENILAQQIAEDMEQIALAASIEPNPSISIDRSKMMAEVVATDKAVPVEEEDCFKTR